MGKRRYDQDVRALKIGLTAGTITALRAMVPAGERSAFVDSAIRQALTEHARLAGAGDLPGERLAAIADGLRHLGQILDREAAKWGT